MPSLPAHRTASEEGLFAAALALPKVKPPPVAGALAAALAVPNVKAGPVEAGALLEAVRVGPVVLGRGGHLPGGRGMANVGKHPFPSHL